jgi:3-oxoacyl-[acyl-carrier protein] reductase
MRAIVLEKFGGLDSLVYKEIPEPGHWAPLHNMTVEETTANFPKEAGIARYGKPEEIAELTAFLVSPGARWLTGSTLRMDGGEVKSI